MGPFAVVGEAEGYAKFCTCIHIVCCRRNYVAKAQVWTRGEFGDYGNLYAICVRVGAGRIARADGTEGCGWQRGERARQAESSGERYQDAAVFRGERRAEGP